MDPLSPSVKDLLSTDQDINIVLSNDAKVNNIICWSNLRENIDV